MYKAKGKLHEVNGNQGVEKVWAAFKAIKFI
jgi:adenylate kinase family enzyme